MVGFSEGLRAQEDDGLTISDEPDPPSIEVVRKKRGRGANPFGSGGFSQYKRPTSLTDKVKRWQPWELDRSLLPLKPPGRPT